MTEIIPYSYKLKDARWLRRRWQILQRDQNKCCRCGFDPVAERGRIRHAADLRTHLEVHHRYYEAGREPWDYPSNALVTLCNACHEYETVVTQGNERGSFLEALLAPPEQKAKGTT